MVGRSIGSGLKVKGSEVMQGQRQGLTRLRARQEALHSLPMASVKGQGLGKLPNPVQGTESICVWFFTQKFLWNLWDAQGRHSMDAWDGMCYLFLSLKFIMDFCCCSVAKSCPILCDPMDCSMPGFPVPHHLPEFTKVHVHWIGNAIQPSHPPAALFFAFNIFIMHIGI